MNMQNALLRNSDVDRLPTVVGRTREPVNERLPVLLHAYVCNYLGVLCPFPITNIYL